MFPQEYPSSFPARTMFTFTKQERAVLSLFVLIVLLGSAIHFSFRKYPSLSDMVNLIDSEQIFFKADLNTATIEELIDVPYIGKYTAENIIHYRQQQGPFQSIAQVKNVKGIKEKNYEKFKKYLKVSRGL
jgi:competence ComEA-like helix-hairpin-helix protein